MWTFFCLFILNWNRNVWLFLQYMRLRDVESAHCTSAWRHARKKHTQKNFYYHPYGRKNHLPTISSFQNVNKNISTLWCGERTRAVQWLAMHARPVPNHDILFIRCIYWDNVRREQERFRWRVVNHIGVTRLRGRKRMRERERKKNVHPKDFASRKKQIEFIAPKGKIVNSDD